MRKSLNFRQQRYYSILHAVQLHSWKIRWTKSHIDFTSYRTPLTREFWISLFQRRCSQLGGFRSSSHVDPPHRRRCNHRFPLCMSSPRLQRTTHPTLSIIVACSYYHYYMISWRVDRCMDDVHASLTSTQHLTSLGDPFRLDALLWWQGLIQCWHCDTDVELAPSQCSPGVRQTATARLLSGNANSGVTGSRRIASAHDMFTSESAPWNNWDKAFI